MKSYEKVITKQHQAEGFPTKMEATKLPGPKNQGSRSKGALPHWEKISNEFTTCLTGSSVPIKSGSLVKDCLEFQKILLRLVGRNKEVTFTTTPKSICCLLVY